MTHDVLPDPGLFRLWPKEPVYDGWFAPAADAAAMAATRVLMLELKSTDEPETDLRALLNEMTVELGIQFATFRAMRAEAERVLASPGDETLAKLARADIKAAADCIGQLVRTLEKIDSLQRTLSQDRARRQEEDLDAQGFAEKREKLLAMLNQRADALARELFAKHVADLKHKESGPAESRAGGKPEAGSGASPGPDPEAKPGRTPG